MGSLIVEAITGKVTKLPMMIAIANCANTDLIRFFIYSNSNKNDCCLRCGGAYPVGSAITLVPSTS